MHLIEYIKKIDFFKNLNEEEMKLLCSISTMSKYENNSILFYENDIKNSLLFLVEGLLKIYKFDKFGNEIFLYHIYENSLISELSSLKSTDISCFSNASFIEDSTILSVNFEKLQEYFLSKIF